ncbi:MAG TPA: multiheme c-type cytochrome [Planctomycetaceae bacterium]|nr:multiheme c-type cytochrome [Planctomycetaceae bacterium]
MTNRIILTGLAVILVCGAFGYVMYRQAHENARNDRGVDSGEAVPAAGNLTTDKVDSPAAADEIADDDRTGSASDKSSDAAIAPATESNGQAEPLPAISIAKPSAPPAPKPLFEGWVSPAAVIVFSGEQHGYIEPCGCSLNQLGGLSRRADLLRQIGEREWPVTAFDGGGLVNNPTRQQGKLKFDMTLRCLTDMRYGAVALGVEELQLSFDFLSYHRPDELPFLAANILFFDDPKFTGAPLTKRVLQIGGVKIGVTAVFGMSLKADAPQAGEFQFEILEPATSLKKVLAELKAERPDLIILLSHAKPDESRKLAETFPEIDIVLTAGGSEDPDPKPKFVGDKTLLVAPGQKGKYMAAVGYFPDAAEQKLRYELIALDEMRFKDTPAIGQHMRDYQEELKDRNLVATELAVEDPRNAQAIDENAFMGAKVCGECHKSAWDVWQTTKHAGATESLKTGREGQNNWINRVYDPECVACHVTGWDPQKIVRYKTGYTGEQATPKLVGQQCENCHGPGGRHVELERQWAKDKKTSDELLTWRKFQRLDKKSAFNLCAKCHDGDNDPHFDSDSFDRYWNEIAHPGKD